jgi:hypothetical protein
MTEASDGGLVLAYDRRRIGGPCVRKGGIGESKPLWLVRESATTASKVTTSSQEEKFHSQQCSQARQARRTSATNTVIRAIIDELEVGGTII